MSRCHFTLEQSRKWSWRHSLLLLFYWRILNNSFIFEIWNLFPTSHLQRSSTLRFSGLSFSIFVTAGITLSNPGKPWNSFSLTGTYIGGRQKKSWAFPILSDFVIPSAFGECKSAFHNVYVQCTTRGHKTLLYINRSVYQLAP